MVWDSIWYGKEVTCKIFNLKIQQPDVSGQEILTADKVTVRVDVLVNYRIIDPLRSEQCSSSFFVYLCVRSVMGTRMAYMPEG